MMHPHDLERRAAGLTIAAARTVCFVLDASESAAQRQSQIVRLVSAVLGRLPAAARATVRFLGNPAAYPADRFAQQAASWFKENALRASVIGPVWEAADEQGDALWAVIGSGPVFDLEDWADSPLLRQTLLVSLGDPSGGHALRRVGPPPEGPGGRLAERAGDFPEELFSPDVEALAARLHDPVVRVELSGPGFMPVWWDHPGYQVAVDGGRAVLVAGSQEDYSLALSYLACGGEPVEAVATHASGRETTWGLSRLSRGENATVPFAAAGTLTAEEAAVFRKASGRQPFCCPRCGREEPWNTLRCRQGSAILGKIVYPSLEQANASGFVLFRAAGARVEFALHPCNVLALAAGETPRGLSRFSRSENGTVPFAADQSSRSENGTVPFAALVALRQGGRAVLCRFDPPTRRWDPTDEQLSPYARVDADTYAILP